VIRPREADRAGLARQPDAEVLAAEGRGAVEPQEQIAAGRHRDAVRDDGLVRLREIVRDAVAVQRHLGVGRVEDLDPVAGARLGERVVGHELVDDQLAVDLRGHRRLGRGVRRVVAAGDDIVGRAAGRQQRERGHPGGQDSH
jgi:hypothetical protein